MSYAEQIFLQMIQSSCISACCFCFFYFASCFGWVLRNFHLESYLMWQISASMDLMLIRAIVVLYDQCYSLVHFFSTTSRIFQCQLPQLFVDGTWKVHLALPQQHYMMGEWLKLGLLRNFKELQEKKWSKIFFRKQKRKPKIL